MIRDEGELRAHGEGVESWIVLMPVCAAAVSVYHYVVYRWCVEVTRRRRRLSATCIAFLFVFPIFQNVDW